MTEPSTLQDRLIAQFDAMPPQMQIAAKHLIDHPQDVALMSMRDLARRAGVSPATMTRLAQFLGASGYEDLRHEQAETIRRGEGFAARALATPHSAPEALVQQVLEELARHVATLTQPETLASIAAAARALSKARRIFVLGARSCHAIAWHFHYVMSLLGERTRHLDGPGGTGPDALMRAQPGDMLLAISVSPYAAAGLELAAHARTQGLGVVAITDSAVAPLAGLADHLLVCPTASPGFFHSLTPAMALSEALCALLAESDRAGALAGLERSDAQLRALGTYATAIPRRPG
ncbi:MurR/RpiR family transcriptional regulator [Paracoccus xiamenensis]|uniref:MurR/RpiR family transcriptional regulator n=1 Tax=Paracoccus xiamenensis TaxID=2714901 RepID=UPI00140A7940|nr:MurR/RpiR family transcriptional regulator [Paracoccus xiamenensis]NHF74599.1 MurR/RpiR family transcriptional regulator [Paracoccus xiamenensis]